MEKQQKQALIVELIFLLIGSFSVNFALMYWWWSRIYVYTGTIFSLSLLILVLFNPMVLYLIRRNIEEFLSLLELQKRSFLIALIFGVVFIIFNLFGVVDTTIHRYLYRSVFIMISIGISVIISLIQKWIKYIKMFERKPKEFMIAFVIDLVSIILFALLLTNIEGLLS